MKGCFTLLVFASLSLYGKDTAFVHPVYPPIVYENGEYNFYKYNPKFIPSNLLHAFKILGTSGKENLERFVNRPKDEVLERGIFDRGYRIRKEFCLQSYSAFSQSFHSRGIYSPYAMQSFILLCFHQYLLGDRIDWNSNKKLALKNLKHENRQWKKRAAHFYRQFENQRTENLTENPDYDPSSFEDQFFNW